MKGAESHCCNALGRAWRSVENVTTTDVDRFEMAVGIMTGFAFDSTLRFDGSRLTACNGRASTQDQAQTLGQSTPFNTDQTMPRYKINYIQRIQMEQTIEAPDFESARKARPIGVYDGIPTSMVPAAVEEIEDGDPRICETDDPPTPLPPHHNRTVAIEVEGGRVRGVYGLPAGWDYVIKNRDRSG